MRLIQYNGNNIRLPEHDWKQLLNRFDATQANLNVFGYYYIHVPALCIRYKYRCSLCPLGHLHSGANRCTYLFDEIMGKEYAEYLHMRDPGVLWHSTCDEEARFALDKIRGFLDVEKQL